MSAWSHDHMVIGSYDPMIVRPCVHMST